MSSRHRRQRPHRGEGPATTSSPADHPATAHLGAHWEWHDEVYLFRELDPGARVLLAVADGSLDLSVPGGRRPAHGWPLAWCRQDGTARTFYTALGHFPAAWESPAFLRHLDGGLSWLLEGSVRGA